MTADPLRAAELSLSDRKEKIAAAQRKQRRQARARQKAQQPEAAAAGDGLTAGAEARTPAGDAAGASGDDEDDNGDYEDTPQVMPASDSAPILQTAGVSGAPAAQATQADTTAAASAPAAASTPTAGSAASGDAATQPESAAEQRAMRLEAQALTPADVARLDGMPLPTLLTIHQLSEAWRTRKSKLASVTATHARASASASPPQALAVPVQPPSDLRYSGVPASSAGPVPAADLAGHQGGAGSIEGLASAAAAAATTVSVDDASAPAVVRLPVAPSIPAQPEVDTAPAQVIKPAGSDSEASLAAAPPDGVQLNSPEDRHRYGFHNQPSVGQQVHLLFWRQVKLTTRNRGYVLARWINALIIGLIVSTVAFGGSATSVQLRVSH